MRQLVSILSTPIDVLDMPGVLGRLEQFIAEKRFHQVATANADFLINAMDDPELRHILRRADLVMPDGMPLVWASRLLRQPLPERVTGADIVPALAALSARKGYRIYMLGARPEVAARARQRLLEDHPTIQIVGCVSPPVRPLLEMDHESLLRDIQQARPDILLVAFGNPKQEKWIHMHREALRNVPVCIGVGGTFDFLAGQTTRAPGWMRQTGLEWLFRLSQEPRRLWRRYSRDITHFGRYFSTQWKASRIRPWTATTSWEETYQGDCTVLSVSGSLDSTQKDQLQARAERILTDTEHVSTHLVLDLSRTSFIDVAIVGTLLNLPHRAAYVGREIRIAAASNAVKRMLCVCGCDDILPLYDDVAAAVRGQAEGANEPHLAVHATRACLLLPARVDVDHLDHLASIEQELAALAASVTHLELDLSGVVYLDCAGMETLRRIVQTARAAGRPVRVCLSDAAAQALSREKLSSFFASDINIPSDELLPVGTA